MEKSTPSVQKLCSAERKNSLRVIHKRRSFLCKRQKSKSIAKILSQNSVYVERINCTSIPFADLFCICGKPLRKGKSDKFSIKVSSESSNTISDNVSLNNNVEERSSEESLKKEDSRSVEDELLRLEHPIDFDKLNLGGNLKYFLNGVKLSSIIGCSNLPKTISGIKLFLDSNPTLKAQLKIILGDNLKTESMKPVADLFASNPEVNDEESDSTIEDANKDGESAVYSSESKSSEEFKKIKEDRSLPIEKAPSQIEEEAKDCSKKKCSSEPKSSETSSSLISKLFGSLFQTSKLDHLKRPQSQTGSSKTAKKDEKCVDEADTDVNKIRKKYDEWFQKSSEEEREKFKWEDFQKVKDYLDNLGETDKSNPNKAAMLKLWLKKFSKEIGVSLSSIDNGTTTTSRVEDYVHASRGMSEIRTKRINSDEMLNVSAGDVVARLNILMKQLEEDLVKEDVRSKASTLNDTIDSSVLPSTINTDVRDADDESSESKINDDESMCQVICASFVHKLNKYNVKDIKSTAEQLTLDEPQESNNYQVFCVPEVITRGPLNCWGRSNTFDDCSNKSYRSESYFLNEVPEDQELTDQTSETISNSCSLRDSHYDRFGKLNDLSLESTYSKQDIEFLDEVNSLCNNVGRKRKISSQKKVVFDNSPLYIGSDEKNKLKTTNDTHLYQTPLLSPEDKNREIEVISTNASCGTDKGIYSNIEQFSDIYQSQKLYEQLSLTSLFTNDKKREIKNVFKNGDDEKKQEKYFDVMQFPGTSRLKKRDRQTSHTSLSSLNYENKDTQANYETSNEENINVISYMKHSPNSSCLNVNTYQTSIQSLETHDTRECLDYISEHSSELLSVLKYLVSLTHLNPPILEKVYNISKESVQSKVTECVGVQCNLPQEHDKVTVISQTSSNHVQELADRKCMLSDTKPKRVASLLESLVISEESSSMTHCKSDCRVANNLSNRHRLSSLPDLLHGAPSLTAAELFNNRSEQTTTDFDNNSKVEIVEKDESADNLASSLSTSISCQVSQTPDVDCFSTVSSSDVSDGNNILLETRSNLELKSQQDKITIKEKSRSEEAQSISAIGLPGKTTHKNRLKKIMWKIGVRDTKKKR